MYTIEYHFLPSTQNGRHPGKFFIKITYQEESIYLNYSFQIYQEEWDFENRCILIKPDNSYRNSYLSELQKEIEKEKINIQNTITLFNQKGIYDVKEIFNNYNQNNPTNFLSEYVDTLVIQLLQTDQERTARAYKSVSKSIIRFNKRNEIQLSQITEEFLKLYEQDMKIKGKSMNTISFYMRNLRSIYNKAISEGLIPPPIHNPFKNVYTGIEKTRKRALLKKDIALLNAICFSKNKELEENPKIPKEIFSESMQNTLLIFFFSFHARGMSFVDLAYLRKENIQNNTISYYRKKTGRMITIKMTPVLQEIINRFSHLTQNSPYVFPFISMDKGPERLQYESALKIYNLRLKRIGKLLKINSPITSHVARHSWASIAKHENLPLWVISEGLGHCNEKTTYIYLSSLEQSILDKANEKIYKAIKKTI